MAASTLGGMVGGAIAIAMYINDYRLCMQNKKIEMPIDDYNIPINIVNEMDTTLIKGIL